MQSISVNKLITCIKQCVFGDSIGPLKWFETFPQDVQSPDIPLHPLLHVYVIYFSSDWDRSESKDPIGTNCHFNNLHPKSAGLHDLQW